MPKWLVAIVLLSSIAAAQSPDPGTRSSGSWSVLTAGGRNRPSSVQLVVSALTAIDGSASHPRPLLAIRCEDGNLAVYVAPGTPANPNVGSIPKAQAVRLFFDHRPPYTEEWTESRNAGTLDSPDPGRLIINLMASQRLQVEVTPLNSRTAAALAFPVTGLIAASTPLQSACPSAWRGVMERLDSLARPSGGSSDRASVYFEFQVEKQAMQLPANPTPAYPPMLRSARVEGEVLAQFVVDTSGRAEPGTFKILKSTHDLFTQSVRDVLPTLRFSPAEMNGRRVRQLVQMPFPFRLTP